MSSNIYTLGGHNLVEITVIGSANIDLVTYCNRLPGEGETIFGNTFQKSFGGKGANQAVQCSLLGVNTCLIGRVGTDNFGDEYKRQLTLCNVNIQHVRDSPKSTGIASIAVDQKGANTIIVVPGANSEVTGDDIILAEKNIVESKVVVCQNEVPLTASIEAFKIARFNHAITIYNPAPGLPLVQLMPLLSLTTILCPNESELRLLADLPTSTTEEVEVAARKILSAVTECLHILTTLGSHGALLVSRDNDVAIHFPVENGGLIVVDTVGAGDSFIGALAANLARNAPLHDSIRRALGCATLSVGRRGAQTSYYKSEELPEHLRVPTTYI